MSHVGLCTWRFTARHGWTPVEGERNGGTRDESLSRQEVCAAQPRLASTHARTQPWSLSACDDPGCRFSSLCLLLSASGLTSSRSPAGTSTSWRLRESRALRLLVGWDLGGLGPRWAGRPSGSIRARFLPRIQRNTSFSTVAVPPQVWFAPGDFLWSPALMEVSLSLSISPSPSLPPSPPVRTALIAIIGFMPTKGEGAIGSLDYTPEERRALAKKYDLVEFCFLSVNMMMMMPPSSWNTAELCLPACLSVSLYLSLCLSVSLSACLFLCLFVSLSVSLSVSVSACLSLCLPVCLFLPACLSLSLCLPDPNPEPLSRSQDFSCEGCGSSMLSALVPLSPSSSPRAEEAGAAELAQHIRFQVQTRQSLHLLWSCSRSYCSWTQSSSFTCLLFQAEAAPAAGAEAEGPPAAGAEAALSLLAPGASNSLGLEAKQQAEQVVTTASAASHGSAQVHTYGNTHTGVSAGYEKQLAAC